MGADELPCAVFGPGGKSEAALQSSVRLVGRNDEVLLDRRARHLAIGALLLVESPYVSDHEPRGEHRLLDGVPYGVAGVVEDDGDPATGLEDPAVLGEAALHQVLIVGDCLSLGADRRLPPAPARVRTRCHDSTR